MTTIESELVAALYGLYALDCVKWVKPPGVAYTRESAEGWREHTVQAMSFTLLGRMPVVADALLLRPGFVRLPAGGPDVRHALRKTARWLNGMWMVELQCRLQGGILLVVVPVVIALHRLSSLWPVLVGMILVSHGLLLGALVLRVRRLKRVAMMKVLGPFLANPLGAVRALEAVGQAVFEAEIRR